MGSQKGTKFHTHSKHTLLINQTRHDLLTDLHLIYLMNLEILLYIISRRYAYAYQPMDSIVPMGSY